MTTSAKRAAYRSVFMFYFEQGKTPDGHFNRVSWQKLAGMHLSTGSYHSNGLWTLSHDWCADIERATEGTLRKFIPCSGYRLMKLFVTLHSLWVFWWKLSHISKISWIIRHQIFVSKYWKLSELWGKSHDSLRIPNVRWVTLWRVWCGPRRPRWWF